MPIHGPNREAGENPARSRHCETDESSAAGAPLLDFEMVPEMRSHSPALKAGGEGMCRGLNGAFRCVQFVSQETCPDRHLAAASPHGASRNKPFDEKGTGSP